MGEDDEDGNERIGLVNGSEGQMWGQNRGTGEQGQTEGELGKGKNL